MSSLIEIAEDLRQDGRCGPRSQRAGEWKWKKQVREALRMYLLDLGVDVAGRLDDAEKQRVWRNTVQDVEWIAEHGCFLDNE